MRIKYYNLPKSYGGYSCYRSLGEMEVSRSFDLRSHMSLGFLTCCGIRGLIRLHQEMHTYALGNGYMIYIYIYMHKKNNLFGYRNVLKGEGLKVRSKCPLPPRHHVTSPIEPLETVAWHGDRVCLRTILPPKNSMFILKKWLLTNQLISLPPPNKKKTFQQELVQINP